MILDTSKPRLLQKPIKAIVNYEHLPYSEDKSIGSATNPVLIVGVRVSDSICIYHPNIRGHNASLMAEELKCTLFGGDHYYYLNIEHLTLLEEEEESYLLDSWYKEIEDEIN